MNWQVDGEYRGSDFTAAVTLGNPDVLVGSGKRWGFTGAREAVIQTPFPTRHVALPLSGGRVGVT